MTLRENLGERVIRSSWERIGWEQESTELMTALQELDKRTSRVLLENDHTITKSMNDNKAQQAKNLESTAKLSQKKKKVVRSKNGWQNQAQSSGRSAEG